jgi:biopolymer transport protein ExbD/biopolymer transport protein TolR
MPQVNNKGTQTSLSEINMVPFIDVVLVLLIIFMITAPILQSGIDVDVPKTHTVKEITEQKLVVTIDKNQRIYLGNDPVNIHQLPNLIKKQAKHSTDVVYLRADETIPFGAFCTVIDAMRVEGIANISIVTQPLNDRNRTP